MSTRELDNLFIGIAGIIGAGKSTLATALARQMNLDVHYEPVDDNVYLADFYRDTPRYSFAMQIYLLNRRFEQHQEIIWRGRGAVQDRTIYEDSIFAKMLSESGLMEPRDYHTYLRLFKNMSRFMCKPSAIVYLDVSPERALERIHERDRGVETAVTIEYLRALYAEYEHFVQDISRRIPTIRVSWEEYGDVEEMAKVIEREYSRASYLSEVKV